MGTSNSQSQEIILDIYGSLFADLIAKYPFEQKNLKKDLDVLRQRVLSEGLSFVTKTLPKLGKAVDSSLREELPLSVPKEFKRSHGNRAVPAFLQGLLSGCFSSTGYLGNIDPDVLRDVRQILFMAYKLELPYSPAQEESVIGNFLHTEMEVSGEQLSSYLPVIHEGARIVGAILSGFDPKDILPRHGPGAVATGERLDEKWRFSRHYSDLHQQYPYYDYFVAGGARELVDRIEWYRSLTRLKSGTAKVVLVPKDSRGPRLISCEPLEYQYVQQGLGRKLMRHLESHPRTKGFINFTSQTINGLLALQSSASGEYCTIDLKDASDRVSLTLVRLLFPELTYKCLEATRTSSTRLPNGSIVPLTKFAPMGSALCFPVESLVFWAIACAAVSLEGGLSYADAMRTVFVYGDDIICRSEHYRCVVDALTSVGLLVNEEKSFHTGRFRESCGVDAYAGVDVTPIRVRTVWSGKHTDGSTYASYIAYANAFGSRGYERTCMSIRRWVEGTFGLVPFGHPSAPYPCWHVAGSMAAFLDNNQRGIRYRYDEKHHCWRIRTRRLVPKKSPVSLQSWCRLLRNLLVPPHDDPSVNVFPRSTKIRTGWLKAS